MIIIPFLLFEYERYYYIIQQKWRLQFCVQRKHTVLTSVVISWSYS
jgi:hypothetical protein